MANTTQPRSWEDMRLWCAELLARTTGTDVAVWNQRVHDSGITDEPTLRGWLAEQGVTGYPQMLLVMERFGYPDFLLASADELIDAQYADRPALRPVLDRLMAALPGSDVTVQARKTYVALVTPRRTFAQVRASTRTRVDLGLRLDGQAPTGRLLPTGSVLGNGACTVRIALGSPADVDGEVLGWLQRAYVTSR
jgi:hypothetical protein